MLFSIKTIMEEIMQRKTRKKKLVSILLCLALILQTFSITVSAEEATTDYEEIAETADTTEEMPDDDVSRTEESNNKETDSEGWTTTEEETTTGEEKTTEEETTTETETESEEITTEEVATEENGEAVLEGVIQNGDLRPSVRDSLYYVQEQSYNLEAVQNFLYKEMKNRKEKIDVSKFNIPIEDAGVVLSSTINANPDLYYVENGYGYSYNSATGKLNSYTVKYMDTDDEAFNNAVTDALSEITPAMSDMEKVVVLHDYLILNTEYDYDNYQHNTVPQESYSAYGALVKRKAVCMGYALAYQYLLNKCGITTYYVSSDSMNHAWNIVKIGNDYYHVDTTWDDPVNDVQGRTSHFYMLISDSSWESTRKHSDWKVYTSTYANEISCNCDDPQYEDAFWKDLYSPVIAYKGKFIYRQKNDILQRMTLYDDVDSVFCTLPFENGTNSISSVSAYSIAFVYNNRIYYDTTSYVLSCKMDGSDMKIHYENKDGRMLYGVYINNGIARASFSDRSSEVITLTNTEDIDYNVIYAKSISLDRTQAEVEVGESISLKPTITPSGASQRVVQWTSNNDSVASVDQKGYVTGISEGSCSITAEVDGVKATCKINVVELNLAAPAFSILSDTVDYNEMVELTAQEGTEIYYTVDGQEPTRRSIRYTQPIPVTKDIVIKAFAVKDGYYDSKVAQKSYIVCTNNLILEDSSVQLTVHDEYVMGIKEVPTTRQPSDVVFVSSDTDKLVVKDNKITAIKAGTVTLTAMVADHRSRMVQTTCTVTILPRTYTVTFIGFKGKEIGTQVVEEGQSANIPTIDMPEGYKLSGWIGDYTNITKDQEIIAQYTPVDYTVTLYTGSGQVYDSFTYNIETDTFRLENLADHKGYRFAGWYYNDEYTGIPCVEIMKGTTGDKNLYAKWVSERGLWMGKKGEGSTQDIPQWPISAKTFTGKKILPDDYVIYDGEEELILNRDYTVSISNNTNANTLSTEKELKSSPTITITGKGDYAGKIVKNFQILPKSIEEEDVFVSDIYVKYNKKIQKPNPVIKYNGMTLAKGKDYTVEYTDTSEDAYIKAGRYDILITGRGNYTGTRTIHMQIVDQAAGQYLMSNVSVSKIPALEYTGSAIDFTDEMPVLKNGKSVLKKDVDYELIQDNSAEIGKHILTFVGKGSYYGTKTLEYQIKGRNISSVKIRGLVPQTYSGLDMEPRFTVADKDTILQEGQDYELSWSNNINAGTATVILTGMNGYFGTKKATFKILPYDLQKDEGKFIVRFKDGVTLFDYQKNGTKPEVIVEFVQGDGENANSVTLTEGVDYTLKYVNNSNVTVVKAGQEPRVEIKGKKNFKNKKALYFNLQNQDIAKATMVLTDLEESKQTGKFYSTPVIYDRNGNKLAAGTDYDNKTYVYQDENGKVLTRSDRPLAGSIITLSVKGKGKYTGEIRSTYRICAANHNLSKASIKFRDSKKKIYYTGSGISLDKNDIRVTIGKTELSTDDFELVDYSNNVKKGTAQVIVKGVGEYAGTKVFKFTISAQNMQWYVDQNK